MARGGASDLIDAAAVEQRIPRRVLLAFIVRVLGVIGGTLLLYAVLPIEGEGDGAALVAGFGAIFAIVVVLVVFARQMSRVSRSTRPVLAAVEALCLVFGLFLTLFALVYVSISQANPQSFSQEIDKVGGLYFTTTVLATVGFGDISAVSAPARILVTVQMVLGMVLIGTAVKALGFSANRAVTARHPDLAAQFRSGAAPRPADGAQPAGSAHAPIDEPGSSAASG